MSEANEETLLTQPEAEPQAEPQAGDEAQPEAGTAENQQPSEAAAVDVPPEEYVFTAPEGMEYDAETMGVYAEAAREAGLSQEKADLILGKLAPHMAEKQAQALAQAREDWAASAKVDKEYGGEKLAESLGTAKKALDAFGTPELQTLLNESGLGNHPEIIRFMVRAGRAISQDTFVPAGRQAVEGDARRLYPNSRMNP